MPRHSHPFDEYHHFGDDLDTSVVLSATISAGEFATDEATAIFIGSSIHQYLEALLERVTDLEVQQTGWLLGNAVKKATVTPPPPGDVWTFYPHSIGTEDPVGDAAYDITYGEGYWVISLASGIHYSPDASDDGSWTGPIDNDAGFNVLFSLAYNGTDRWVGVGSQRTISSAATVSGPWSGDNVNPDGGNFGHPATFGTWNDVGYGNGLWVVVGGVGTSQSGGRSWLTSTDGINWTNNNNNSIPWGSSGFTFAVAYGDGLWAIVGYQNISGTIVGGIATSTDPTVGWTSVYTLPSSPVHFITDIEYGDGLWTAVGSTFSPFDVFVVTSTDGVNWTKRNLGNNTLAGGNPQSIAYGGGNWVIVGEADDFNVDVKVHHAADPRTDTFVAADAEMDATFIWAAHYQNGIWAVLGENDNTADVFLSTSADPTTLLPTADAFIVAIGTGGLSLDATIRSTIAGSLTADAAITSAISGSFTANATLAIGVGGSFTADALLVSTSSASVTGDATILSTRAGSLTADAVIFRTISGTFTADASITNAVSGSFSANAVILRTIAGSATADAVIEHTQTGSFTGNAFVPGRFTADAVLEAGGGSEDFQSDAFQSDAFE